MSGTIIACVYYSIPTNYPVLTHLNIQLIQGWAEDGECEANQEFMAHSCKKSCNLCGQENAPPAETVQEPEEAEEEEEESPEEEGKEESVDPNPNMVPNPDLGSLDAWEQTDGGLAMSQDGENAEDAMAAMMKEAQGSVTPDAVREALEGQDIPEGGFDL